MVRGDMSLVMVLLPESSNTIPFKWSYSGPGGVLGIGGPESGRFVGFSVLPVTGYIEIDSADIDSLVDDGRLGDFVKQQFGLVVSISATK
jgi:hypothetical protein